MRSFIVSSLIDMPLGPPEDLAHARWRVRFFKHLVEEHRTHQLPQDEQWSREDAEYSSHLTCAEEALSDMEASRTPRASENPLKE